MTLDSSQTIPIAVGQQALITNPVLVLANGGEFIHSVTVVNTSSLVVYLYPGREAPAGQAIELQPGAATIAVAEKKIYVSAPGTSTAKGFIYLHWTTETLSAYSSTVTATNVQITNTPNVSITNVPNISIQPNNIWHYHGEGNIATGTSQSLLTGAFKIGNAVNATSSPVLFQNAVWLTSFHFMMAPIPNTNTYTFAQILLRNERNADTDGTIEPLLSSSAPLKIDLDFAVPLPFYVVGPADAIGDVIDLFWDTGVALTANTPYAWHMHGFVT